MSFDSFFLNVIPLVKGKVYFDGILSIPMHSSPLSEEIHLESTLLIFSLMI